jgi:glycolate oxidase FAD binding subunit
MRELRTELERGSGSLIVLHRPAGIAPLDAWGNAGDALPLMRAVKQQFDPKSTLNPGRFVGGI